MTWDHQRAVDPLIATLEEFGERCPDIAIEWSSQRKTMERAWIRLRHNGYLAFQARVGKLIEQHLTGNLGETALLWQLDSAFAASNRPG